jgi:nudix-type nucleoside diphosphatase (YffH/AdpP family)
MSLDGRVKVLESEVVFKQWSTVTRARLLYRRSNGEWQEQVREVSDHGDGAAILLFNRAKRAVVLIKQFRYATYSTGYQEQDIEVPAGLLDDLHPDERICLEAEEETGFAVTSPLKVMSAFVSPGSMTERVHLYVAEYDSTKKINQGGGKVDEGEDIEVLEMPFADALAMVNEGQIVDLKTIVLLQYLALNEFRI